MVAVIGSAGQHVDVFVVVFGNFAAVDLVFVFSPPWLWESGSGDIYTLEEFINGRVLGLVGIEEFQKRETLGRGFRMGFGSSLSQK